jgi:hypothetical protein
MKISATWFDLSLHALPLRESRGQPGAALNSVGQSYTEK